MKKVFYVALAAFVMTSCSDQAENLNPEQGISEGISAGASAMRIDFTRPVSYEFSTPAEEDAVISEIIKDVYDVELVHTIDRDGNEVQDEFSINIVINRDLGSIIVTPKPVQQVIITNGDNEDCGGKPGDGWKSYGSCQSKSCVEDKSKQAAKDLSKDGLSTGKCLDIRVKRNTFSATVCGRVISC